ncbi:MAG: hypothetical protein QNI84_08160 [Henriciella sp.]|nr:hypothetical protein [Henriciella sp.]
MSGLAALAVVQSVTAYAEPANADIWIGFHNSDDGFLLDSETGKAWMTGVCLKELAPATQSGTLWTSHNVELVSVGRGMALLEQRFELELNPANPQILVESAGRGGVQSFDAVMDDACRESGLCTALVARQVPCDD